VSPRITCFLASSDRPPLQAVHDDSVGSQATTPSLLAHASFETEEQLTCRARYHCLPLTLFAHGQFSPCACTLAHSDSHSFLSKGETPFFLCLLQSSDASSALALNWKQPRHNLVHPIDCDLPVTILCHARLRSSRQQLDATFMPRPDLTPVRDAGEFPSFLAEWPLLLFVLCCSCFLLLCDLPRPLRVTPTPRATVGVASMTVQSCLPISTRKGRRRRMPISSVNANQRQCQRQQPYLVTGFVELSS
jgi:hypothetical protein